MHIVVVTIPIKPEQASAFIEATLDNARNTRKEPGNLRFDVSQGEDDANRFMLYEVYKTKEDFAKHQQTEHYFRWKAKTADMMSGTRTAAKYQPLFYGESEVPK